MFALAPIAAIAVWGCASHEQWIDQRPPSQPLAAQIPWFGSALPDKPCSPTTVAIAAPQGLDPQRSEDRAKLLALLEREADGRSSAEVEYAISELAGREADRLMRRDPDAALGYYAESLIHGRRALAADPHERVAGTTQRYNRSLKLLLRALRKRDLVRPGATVPLPLAEGVCSIAIELHSERWTKSDFQSFEFADDYQVTGLRNHYHTSGVGVPLIGVRYHADRDDPLDRLYPSKVCYALTAVARTEESPPTAAPGGQHSVQLVLELHDPLDHETVAIAGRQAPLESDLTTPLAYYLDQPELHEEKLSTQGLFTPASVEQLQGLYMLEPYDPERMPVVMVHGLWSSPATWMEMFNDLRSDPEVRGRYQFWFYLYPTGSPFWVNAARLRRDMQRLRETVDPDDTARALDHTVLVGHSMGGLLARLQSVDSGDEFWRIVSERQFDELDADPETRRYLSDLFYFRPSPSVERVVTIGTPHRGSRFANGFTQWLGAKLIAFPMRTMAKRQELFRRNPDFFRPQIATRVMTSIDSLSPESPMLGALLAARPGPWVAFHNVVGDAPRTGFSRWVSSRGDGIVSYDSARLDDMPQLASQIVVPEEHTLVHRHPQAIAEVRRVLIQQLRELDRPAAYAAPSVRPAARPVTAVRLASGETPVHAVAP